MVIGKGGDKIKTIGREARLDMEELFGRKVYLETWVKVKSGWLMMSERCALWATWTTYNYFETPPLRWSFLSLGCDK